jgi:integrase
MKRPFLLFKRGGYWYYRLADDKTFHTTGQKSRSKAEAFVIEFIKSAETLRRQRHVSFRLYAEPFFVWDHCPHVRRLHDEGKSVTRRHARIQRQQLEKHILSDPFAGKRLSEITRADVLDLRSRLLAKNAPATVNKTLGLVKVIFREALYREETPRDPTTGVGRIKYRRKERGTFTVEELRALFPEHGYGPWRDVQDYTCFYLAAVTGLRRGEILVLRWRHVDFDRCFLTVSEAWKGGSEIGLPKWGHPRLVPLSPRTIDKLHRLQAGSIHLGPDDFVFCYDRGARLGETWWRKRFCAAMDRAGINRQARCLTPHSFRHTINTIVRNSGHDPAKIRAVLGWMDEAVQDAYTHWDLDHLKEWADIVDTIWQA